MNIRIPNRVIGKFLSVKERVREQVRASGVEPNDAAIFERMIEVLDTTAALPPLPAEATPDILILTIQRCLDLGHRSMDAADRLDAIFRTQFPDDYAARAAEDEPPLGGPKVTPGRD